MKKTIVLCFLVLAVIAVVSLFFFGWRLFGFKMCDSPESVSIKEVSIEDGYINVSGMTMNSARFFDGYVVKIDGNTAYLGIKTRTFFAGSKSSQFDISIPIENEISTVILTDSKNEIIIYPISEVD